MTIPAASSPAEAAVRQDIEYLRRWYARAADLFCTRDPANVAAATAIFRRVFTAEARVRYTHDGVEQAAVVGPDAWGGFVMKALSKYRVTQHLIGTQLVEIDSLRLAPDQSVVAGEARMSSYLHAWHAGDRLVRLFTGTYFDQVRFQPGIGWQIMDMNIALAWRWDREPD